MLPPWFAANEANATSTVLMPHCALTATLGVTPVT